MHPTASSGTPTEVSDYDRFRSDTERYHQPISTHPKYSSDYSSRQSQQQVSHGHYYVLISYNARSVYIQTVSMKSIKKGKLKKGFLLNALFAANKIQTT